MPIPDEDSQSFVTLLQLQVFHKENKDKIIALENSLLSLKNDTEEIVEWVRNAKLGGKVISKGFNCLGRGIVWIIKFFGAIAMLWGIATAVKEGKLPSFNIFP